MLKNKVSNSLRLYSMKCSIVQYRFWTLKKENQRRKCIENREATRIARKDLAQEQVSEYSVKESG